jgi:hypothetical protein
VPTTDLPLQVLGEELQCLFNEKLMRNQVAPLLAQHFGKNHHGGGGGGRRRRRRGRLASFRASQVLFQSLLISLK